MNEKKTIVAVDDSPLILKTLEKMLEDSYELHPYSKTARALHVLKSQELIPDLIILDIEMPEMNGYDVLSKIREFEHLDDVPVIFLTANKNRDSVIKAATNGANDYVIKPLDKAILLKKITALLRNANKSKESED